VASPSCGRADDKAWLRGPHVEAGRTGGMRWVHRLKVVAWLGSGRKTTAWQAFVGRAAEKPPRLAGSVKKAEVLLGRCGMGRGKEAGCTTPWAERRIRTRDNF
jgi:hypothetical protein